MEMREGKGSRQL